MIIYGVRINIQILRNRTRQIDLALLGLIVILLVVVSYIEGNR